MGLDRKSIEASHIWFDMWCWETPFVNKQGVTKLTFTRNIKGATFECTSYRSVFLITWPKYEKFLLSPHSKMLIHFIQCISSLHFRFAHSYNYKLCTSILIRHPCKVTYFIMGFTLILQAIIFKGYLTDFPHMYFIQFTFSLFQCQNVGKFEFMKYII